MNTNTYDDAQEFARLACQLSPQLLNTGKVPEADREAFAAYQAGVKRCGFCGKLLRPLAPRSRKAYCDDACKMRAYRRRRIRQVKQPNQESDHGRTR